MKPNILLVLHNVCYSTCITRYDGEKSIPMTALCPKFDNHAHTIIVITLIIYYSYFLEVLAEL